ncbi:MAG: hypothetical protein Q4D99_05130 [Bacillota bacterium]|nr:hypothetical protein [Bacillota bacterium]
MKIIIDDSTEDYIVSEYDPIKVDSAEADINDRAEDAAYAVAAICLDFVQKFYTDSAAGRTAVNGIGEKAKVIFDDYMKEHIEAEKPAEENAAEIAETDNTEAGNAEAETESQVVSGPLEVTPLRGKGGKGKK